MKLKLFMPTTSIAGGLFMLKRTTKPQPFRCGNFLLFQTQIGIGIDRARLAF